MSNIIFTLMIPRYNTLSPPNPDIFIIYVIYMTYHIRDVRGVRHFLTQSVAKAIASSLTGSKLDYCNYVLFNVTKKEISKLQRVKNCMARVSSKHKTFAQHLHNICTTSAQRLRRCSNIVQMLYKCFVFTGL